MDLGFLILLGILIGIFVNAALIDELVEDYTDIKDGVPDNHTRDFWLRMLMVVVVSFFGGIWREALWGKDFLTSFIACIAFATGCFVLIFDYALNKLRGLPWDYLGNDPIDGSRTDTFLRRFNPYHVLVIKSLAFLAGLLLYIFL